MILSDIAEVKPGYPFRRKIVIDEDATTRVIQLRDLNAQGILNYYQGDMLVLSNVKVTFRAAIDTMIYWINDEPGYESW